MNNPTEDKLISVLSMRKILISALQDMISGGHQRKAQGICSNLKFATKDFYSESEFKPILLIFSSVWGGWEHYSTNEYYPVPHPSYMDINENPRVSSLAEDIFDGTGDMYAGLYGGLRISLCNHLLRGLIDGSLVLDYNGKYKNRPKFIFQTGGVK